MYKIATAAVALAALTTTSAIATTFPAITPGVYSVTTEYTALDDTSGLCGSAGVVVGGFTTGNAYVGGAGATAHSIVAMPSTTADGSPVQINNLTCDYGAFPPTIATGTGTTAFTGGATCVASYSYVLKGSATYSITAGSGSSTINSVIPENTADAKGITTPLTTANSFHITSSNVAITLINPAGFGQICTVSLDSLFVRIGK